MSDVKTDAVTELEELLDEEVPCLKCGKAAQLRSDRHGHGMACVCISCWQPWFKRITATIAKYGRVKCDCCPRSFATVEAFADYRLF